jgi:hypothetical protein
VTFLYTFVANRNQCIFDANQSLQEKFCCTEREISEHVYLNAKREAQKITWPEIVAHRTD